MPLKHSPYLGIRKDKAYSAWKTMKNACNSPSSKHYKHIGKLGIRVCSRWDSYDAFYSDMGPKPPNTYLYRKDINKHFEAL